MLIIISYIFFKINQCFKSVKIINESDVTSEIPLSQGFTMTYVDSSIVASSFKQKFENESVTNKNKKNEQNNYTNKYLYALGEYLILKSPLA